MTYAEYLATQTVKALQEIARQAGIVGRSKLRKAGLVLVIDVAATTAHVSAAKDVEILDVESAADHGRIREIMTEVAPITFSEMPATPAQIVAEPTTEQDAEASEADEILFAYRAMRRTVRDMGNTPARVKIVARMRTLHAAIRATGYNMRTV